MNRKLQIAAGIVFVIGGAIFLMPLGAGICHIGMLLPSAVFLLIAAILFFPKPFHRLWQSKLKPLIIVCGILLCGVVILTAVTIGCMLHQSHNRPAAEADLTVVVLGCEVNKDHPSLMLQARIDAAYEYLCAHPNALCVASGGMDDEEIMTEAQCIRDTLVSMGIDAERIYMEDASHSTRENLLFSAQLIEDHHLSTNVAIASDNFHQLRAALYAREYQLTPYSLGCSSFWVLAPGYWMRDAIGIWAYFILGH